MWSISDQKSEYQKYHRLLDGSLKTVVDNAKLNAALLANSSDYFRDKSYFVVAHDPSEIRKPHSSEASNLCKVKDFNGQLINGYKTQNSVVMDRKGKDLRLMQTTPYSTTSEDYITNAEYADYKADRIKNATRVAQIEALVEQGTPYNLRLITQRHIGQISQAIRKENPEAVIVDVLDRGFDDAGLFEFETDLGNLFVVRSKLNRNSNEMEITQQGKERYIKLKNQHFTSACEKQYTKLTYKNKNYQQVKALFEWNYVQINGRTYSVLRVSMWQRNGKRLFKEPMLLITNMQVDNELLAELVFELYMKRSKIEGVFRFCKTVLGWETIQIPDFTTVKNLLSLVFLISGYFYEIEDQLTQDPNIEWLANLGGGKGKVTRQYVLNGIARLIEHQLTEQYFKDHDISKQQIQDALKMHSSLII